MTGNRAILVTVGIVGALAGCGNRPAGEQAPARHATAADAKAIEAAVRHYVAVSNRGDIDELAGLYTDDAVLLPPEHAPIQGRAAIAEFWRQGTDHGLSIRTMRVDVQSDLGYLVGRYTLPATDQEPADSGKYLLCLRRQPDGSWKVTADMWNSSTAADADSTDSDDTADSSSDRWPIS